MKEYYATNRHQGHTKNEFLDDYDFDYVVDDVIDFETYPLDLILVARRSYLKRTFSLNKNDLETLVKKAII